jgi:hypothetical protein
MFSKGLELQMFLLMASTQPHLGSFSRFFDHRGIQTFPSDDNDGNEKAIKMVMAAAFLRLGWKNEQLLWIKQGMEKFPQGSVFVLTSPKVLVNNQDGIFHANRL